MAAFGLKISTVVSFNPLKDKLNRHPKRMFLCTPLVYDVSEGGEGQQDVAGHPQEGQLRQHLQPTQPVRKTYISVGKS